MSKSNSKIRLDRVVALENELELVKSELAGLKLGRSFRIVKFLKELKSSKPKEFYQIIKSAPGLLKRYDPPEAKLNIASNKKQYSSAHNSLPLLKYPNINIVTLGSISRAIFSDTCSSFELGSGIFQNLMKYDSAIQLISIDASTYNREKHQKYVVDCMKKGVVLVVIYDTPEHLSLVRQSIPKKNTILEIQLKTLAPFIDIYSLNISLPKTRVNYQISNKLSSSNKDIFVLDSISTNRVSWRKKCKINKYVSEGGLILLKGEKRPKWLSKEIWLCKDEQKIEESRKILSIDYNAEQYAVKCSRDTILSFNTLNIAEEILYKNNIITNKAQKPSVGVIASTRRPNNVASLLNQIEKQSFPINEIALLLHGASEKEFEKIKKDIKKYKSLNIILKRIDSSIMFGDVLNIGLDMLSTDLITKMDDDDFYLPNHILDLYTAHLHSCADFVGKWNNWVFIESENKTINWVPENSNQYVKHLPGATFLVKRDILKNLRFGKVPRAIDSELYRRAEKRGATLYSTHRYNFVRKRGDDHTYDAKSASFKSRAHKIEFEGLDLDTKLNA